MRRDVEYRPGDRRRGIGERRNEPDILILLLGGDVSDDLPGSRRSRCRRAWFIHDVVPVGVPDIRAQRFSRLGGDEREKSRIVHAPVNVVPRYGMAQLERVIENGPREVYPQPAALIVRNVHERVHTGIVEEYEYRSFVRAHIDRSP